VYKTVQFIKKFCKFDIVVRDTNRQRSVFAMTTFDSKHCIACYRLLDLWV